MAPDRARRAGARAGHAFSNTEPDADDTRGSPDPNAAWNFLVWPQFVKRVSRDVRARDAVGTPTRFLIVHAVLIGISLGLALVSLIVAIIALIDR